MYSRASMEQARSLLANQQLSAAQQLLYTQHPQRDADVMLRELLIGERRNEQAAQIATRLTTGSDAEALVSQAILAHFAGNLPAAVQCCEKALNTQPQLATAQNHLGRALHNMGRPEQALAAFKSAVAADKHYAEAWHNQGHVLRALGQLPDAISVFQRACELAPGYRSARLNLGISLFAMERGREALDCFEQLLSHDGDDVEALMNAGLSLHLLGRFDEAKKRYQQALALVPKHATAWYYYGVLLNELQETSAAMQALQKAVELNPQDVEAWIELAGVHEQSNELEKAEQAVRRAQTTGAQHPALLLEVAKLTRRKGQPGDAVKLLQRLDARQLPSRLAQQYFFELGLALDRDKQYESAYQAFLHGNQLAANSQRRQGVDKEAFPALCQRIQNWLEHNQITASLSPPGELGEDLCFMIGFPRSGTTLLDTMLAVHPDVVSIEEQATLEWVIARLNAIGAGYPENLNTLSELQLDELRQLYRQRLASILPQRPYKLIVDKLPMRTIHAALIHRLFPKAKLLFSLRHPCDVVLSNFMQQYAVNEAFVHFDTLTDCSRTYDQVMQIWQTFVERYSPDMKYVRYEALVSDPQAALQQVCDFLGIEAQQSMLDRDARLNTRDRVRTNSYQQVAEPIYQRASGRWQHYRQHLAPHLSLLQPHLEYFGYDI